MTSLPTLIEAVNRRLASHKPLGWTPGRRCQIEIVGDKATLTIGWLTTDGSPMLPDLPGDKTIAGGSTISVDDQDMPPGVSISSWSSLPDTVDAIAPPTDDELRGTARLLGCRYIDRGDRADGATIYWLAR